MKPTPSPADDDPRDAEQCAPRPSEIELRACCGKLRWALLDVIEPLPGGTRISGLRWGPEVVPLNLETDSAAAPEVVDTILEEAEQWLGSSTSCYTGRGALVIGSDEDADARHRR